MEQVGLSCMNLKKKQSATGSRSGLRIPAAQGSDLRRSLNLSVLPFLHPLMYFVNIQLSSAVAQEEEQIQPLASSLCL